MSKKKSKFDLSTLVHQGYVKDGETLYFVSDPKKNCAVKKLPNGDYKLTSENVVYTLHAFAQACLGTEPPEHASRWLRTQGGKTLYELWQADEYAEAA